jgi:glycosyltransferase involved in cell wall biosynthesis
MNLLYTITSFLPSTGGAQIHMHQLALQLKSRHSLQVTAFWNRNRTDWLLGTTLKADAPGRQEEVNGIPIHLLGWSLQEKLRLLPAVGLYYFFMHQIVPVIASQLIPQLEHIGHNIDLVHNVRVGREPLSWASMLLARRKDIPFVFTPLHHPRWNGIRYQVYHNLYRQADALIALTRAEKEYMISVGVKEERVHILGHGPVLAQTSNPRQFLNTNLLSGQLVLFIGQHFEYKGFREVLKAAPLVWQKAPDTRFVFIGPPVQSSEALFQHNLDPRILRLGAVDLQTKTDALAACDLLCVPSTQESFGGVYTEAWSFEKPIIGCSIPAVREIVSEGEDGFLVDQQPAQIAERILYLLQHPSKAKEMGQNGKLKVEKKFSWEYLAQLTESIYRKLL